MAGDSKFCIVSPWMELGNMHNYLRNNQVADRVELVSLESHPQFPVFDLLWYSCSV